MMWRCCLLGRMVTQIRLRAPESRLAVSNTFHVGIFIGRYRAGTSLYPHIYGVKGKYKKQHNRLSSVPFALSAPALPCRISDIVILCRQLVNNILNKAHPHFHPHIQDSQIFYRILMAAYSKICCFRDNHHSNVFQE